MTEAAKPLRFSLDSITLGDMEDLEEITGQSLDDILALLQSDKVGQNGSIGIPIKVLKALVFVIYRHGDPNFTLEDARKVKVTELELDLGPDPTEAAG